MKKILALALITVVLSFISTNAVADWDKTFGETSDDYGYSVRQTADGGYIIAGMTFSYGTGYGDVYLIKTDSSGNKRWANYFGGELDDYGASVQQTTDGGYIITGATGFDLCLIKTNSLGIKLWSKTFGWIGLDYGASVQQTTDGGYIIAGTTSSYGAGYGDVWLIKTDSSGNKLWDKTFGGVGEDEGASVQQTTDGGYIVAGTTSLYGGNRYVWLIRTNSLGNKVWDKTFGGGEGASVQQTNDGGYIIAGTNYEHDAYLIKTDSSGNKLWDKTFGGANDDDASSVQQTTDGGYIVAGTTSSYGAGGHDVWLIKTNSLGNKVWDKTFGDVGNEEGSCVQQTTDGGYIIAGTTSPFFIPISDVWLIKTFGDAPTVLTEITLVSPANGSVLTVPPTFMWNPNGGVDNRFAVELSYSPAFSPYWSTYVNLHQPIAGNNWAMSSSLWNKIPHGKTVYWKVTGADLSHQPMTYVYSGQIWTFTKQ
jgi:hypothetical protein